MADEATTSQPSDPVQEEVAATPSPSPSPSPTPTEPTDGEVEEPALPDADPPPFQERMDGIRDAFRETYQAFGSSKTGAKDAKAELERAQAVYDGKMTEVADARSANLVATREYIRILQEHEAALVAEG